MTQLFLPDSVSITRLRPSNLPPKTIMFTRLTYRMSDLFYFGLSAPRRGLVSIACSAALFLTVGCGGESGPETVPVAGTVTLNGEPISGAEVTFMHEEFTAYGTTDAEGRFSLEPGAVVGNNKVVVSKWEGEMNEDEGMDAGQMEAMAIDGGGGGDAPKQLVPAEYTSANTTPLSFSVPEGGTESADFDL